MTNKFSLPFLTKKQVAKDTFSFYFDRTKLVFDYTAGQYVRMILPHESADDRGTMRYFTLASSPSEKESLMITTKVVQSSFKKTLYDLKYGEEVQFDGPYGSYVLDQKTTRPQIFLSGGIGITPFRSMLKFASDTPLKIPLVLFASFPTLESVVFYDELTSIARSQPNISAFFSLTKPVSPGKSWKGEVGRFSEALLKSHLHLRGDEMYYICGPTPMVDETRDMLMQMGIDVESINLEYFSGY